MPVSKPRKRKGGRARPAPRRHLRPTIPDPIQLAARCAEASRALTGRARERARSEAQDLIYDAWESSPARALANAMTALEIYPDCADAIGILAQGARSQAGRLAFWEAATAAGERDVGPDIFREDAGHFWGLLETRPYMRARAGLAEALAEHGRRDDAIEHVSDMLRLNPSDNQGLRYLLIGWLMAENRDDGIDRLFAAYADEHSPQWAYARALIAFRRQDGKADEVLQDALDAHDRVPVYLLGRARLPREMPAMIEMGGETEAIEVAFEQIEAWRATEGALAWLAAMFDADEADIGPGPKPGEVEELLSMTAIEDLAASSALTDDAEVTEFIRRAFVLQPSDDLDAMVEKGILDPFDGEHRMIIISGEHPEFAEALERGDDHVEVDGHVVNPHIHLALHGLVADQIWDRDPPEVWTTVVRLAGMGYERHDIMHMLCYVAGEHARAALAGRRAYDHELFVKELDALPESWEGLAGHH